jgi:large subunit ribosomal protein L7/L12
MMRPHYWVAVDDKTLAAGSQNPSQFKPSIQVLPGGALPVPADLVRIDAQTPVCKGAPLKAEWGGKWVDVTVLDVKTNGKLKIHWEGYSSTWDEDRGRDTLLIAKDTLAALKKPGAAAEFAKRAEAAEPGIFEQTAARRHLRDYPIEIPLPRGAARVTDETPLEEGTKLGCSWARQWYNVTVLEVNDDNTVKIRWDKHGAAWDGDVSRECLAIDKRVLAKLERKAGASATKPASSTEPAAEGGGDRFRIVLKEVGANKVAVTKTVMEITGLDLGEAKEFIEAVPLTLKQNLTKTAAEKLRADLQKSGGKVAVELQ